MGEEVIFICFILLSKIFTLGKLIFLSNDTHSRDTFISVQQYIKREGRDKIPTHLTSPALFCKIVKYEYICNQDDLRELIYNSTGYNNIYAYYIDRYSIESNSKSFTVDELVDKIFNDSEFHLFT